MIELPFRAFLSIFFSLYLQFVVVLFFFSYKIPCGDKVTKRKKKEKSQKKTKGRTKTQNRKKKQKKLKKSEKNQGAANKK